MKKHPYIFAAVSATLLAIVVWLCTPKEYTATTKVSDEYKEMDLAIGLSHQLAYIKGSLNIVNKGINDIEVYLHILDAESFVGSIARKQVPGKGMTYGEYLGKKDTIECVAEHLHYNFNSRTDILTISFTDRDPLVAAQMLDSVTAMLQSSLTRQRCALADAALQDAVRQRVASYNAYRNAQQKYVTWVDSHSHSHVKSEQSREQELERDAKLAYDDLKRSIEKETRQKALKQRVFHSFTVLQANTVPVDSNDHVLWHIFAYVLFALSLTKIVLWGKEFIVQRKSFDFGNLFSPWGITCAVWGGVLFLLMTTGDLLDPLSANFFIDITLWIVILCVVSFLVYNFMPSNRVPASNVIEINETFFNILYVLAMIFTPLYVYQIYKLVIMFDTKDLMLNIRELAINGDGYGLLNYTFLLNEVLLLIAVWRYPKLPLWKLLTIIGACLTYAVANMEKITFFLVFTSIIFVLYERGKIRLQTIGLGSVSIIFLFYIFNLARAGEDNDYSKNETLLDFIGMYMLSGPVAYGRLRQTISEQFGPESLWSLYMYYGKYFTGVIPPHQAFQEFVYVPMSTNVYSVLRPFYTDFGHIGVAYFAYLYGIMAGVAYRLKKEMNPFGTCFYTYIVFLLMLQFFDELFTASFPQVVNMTILLVLVTQQKFKFSFKAK